MLTAPDIKLAIVSTFPVKPVLIIFTGCDDFKWTGEYRKKIIIGYGRTRGDIVRLERPYRVVNGERRTVRF